MSKSENIRMRNLKRQGNMTHQKVNNHPIENLVDSEGDENSDSEFKRMMIRMFNEFKDNTKTRQ
jgi:CRISPR/Cas system CMR-associated protein Cmr5 small subunit